MSTNYSSYENLTSLFTDLGNRLRSKPTAVEVTQAQYNALTPAEKADTSKIYMITDQGGGGGGCGLLPYFYIDSEAGSTVTVTAPDGSIITPTAVGSGHWECEVPMYGTYIIHSVLAGQGDATISVAVDDVKEYHITDNHFDFTINITAPSGSTIRITSGTEIYTGTGTGSSQAFAVHQASATYTVAVTMDGNTKSSSVASAATTGQSTNIDIEFGTITVSVDSDFITAGSTITCTKDTTSCTPKSAASTVVFNVPEIGEWDITGTADGKTYTVKANVISLSTNVQVTLQTIPDGKTVVPTNVIQTWLNCAEIFDKSYTTLAEVLADEDTLRALMTSDNAIDYLKRSTEWSVSGATVPTLAADNGKVYVNQTLRSGEEGWKVFDGNNSTFAGLDTAADDGYVGYIFDDPISINRAYVYDGNVADHTFAIEYSDDGTDWTQCSEFTPSHSIGTNQNVVDVYVNEITGAHRYWRIHRTSSGGARTICYELQFYPVSIPNSELAMSYIGAYDYAADELMSDSTWSGAIINSKYIGSVLNTVVPTMTSTTSPKGEVKSSGDNSRLNAPSWRAFDGETVGNVYWASPDNTTSGWIQYKFERKANIVAAIRLPQDGYNFAAIPWTNAKIQAFDNEGDTPVDLVHYIRTQLATMEESYEKEVFDVRSNNTKYQYYRLYADTSVTNAYIYVMELQFYGREAGGVQNLLKLAGIDKPYTTIEELLSDYDALQHVISSHDAIDYLVDAKIFIDAITSDATAMRLIGKRNYAADTLLADSEWCEAIVKSSYALNVLNISVPILTGDSADVSASSYYVNSKYSIYGFPWHAFDGINENRSHSWTPLEDEMGSWIQYHFAKEFKPIAWEIIIATNNVSFTAHLTGSKGGSNWSSDLGTLTTADGSKKTGILSINDEYDYYKVSFPGQMLAKGGTYDCGVTILQFYGREDVDETNIDIYSAVNDTFYEKDSSGNIQIIDTTDPNGYVATPRTSLPNGIHTLYSSVAKNPNDLEAATPSDYFKTIKIDDSTIEICIMPDDALYWWGYEPNIENCTNANGWTPGTEYSFNGTVNHNTQDITLQSPSFPGQCGIGVKNPVNCSGLMSIETKLDSVNYAPILVLLNSKNFNNEIARQDPSTNIPTKNVMSRRGFVYKADNAYPTIECGNAQNFKIHALTGNGLRNVEPTYLSAAYDTLYIMDGARQIPIATTNGEGKSFDALLEPGTYTICSSVAKNPSNLSNPYSVEVTITATTQTVKIMPENTLYWWGYKSNECIALSGWTLNGSYNGFVDPTYNDNNAVCAPSSLKYSGLTTDRLITGTKVCGIAKTDSTELWMNIFSSKDMSARIGTVHTFASSMEKAEMSISQNCYPLIYSGNGKSGTVYAFWYE